ncbi:GPN-loop GTPase 1 [Sinocyclocheilus grahami]|uniref:GPN-loop GTPase 1 n=1 Tax=Sinocyclocheilus grahami TaxID=75366 RepID=UPI0007ACAF48|nr:PREDICTED: GPN-loop GTPase 1-like [Sinocyclocheilus grahami]
MATAAAAYESDQCREDGDTPRQSSSNEPNTEPKSVCLIVLGMAGSGKTTFVQRLTVYLHSKKSPPYVINLDPAVHEVPFPANIDIRDTVNYKEVMKQYGLGPNGGIVTSLNLFSTRFDQVMKFIEKKQSNHQYVLIDTPGQIEVFTWSASGTIITEALASSFPCVVIYVMDTSRSVNPVTFMSNMLYACSTGTIITEALASSFPCVVIYVMDTSRSVNPVTFMSNMLYACSILYKTKLPFIVVMNKVVGVSAVTGSGLDELFVQVADAAKEYETEYRPEYERLHRELAEAQSQKQQEQLERLRKDMGAVPMETAVPTDAPALGGPSDLIFTCGNSGEAEEDIDSDTDDIDHTVIEESKEAGAFKSFLKERREIVQVRNRKSK